MPFFLAPDFELLAFIKRSQLRLLTISAQISIFCTIMDTPLSEEETRALVEDRILFLPNVASTASKRKVSGALLTPPSSQGSISSSSTSSVSVRFRSFNSSILFTIDLPHNAYSPDGLEFIGFNPQVASQIFHRWANRPDPHINPDDLIDYVFGHTRILSTPAYEQYRPDQAMSRIGLKLDLQNAILDPNYGAIFRTETLQYWVNDTLRVNWLTLSHLLRRLKKHATISVAKKRGKRAKLEGVFGSQQSTLGPSTSQQPDPTAVLNIEPEEHHLPESFIKVDTKPAVLQDHVVLYKRKAALEMSDLQWIRDDGSLDMGAISSYRGGDFNHRYEAWYFTPEKEYAELYRGWAARRSPMTDTWMIRIQVPNSFLRGLKQKELYYSPDWKQYIWYCKKKIVPPLRFNDFWQRGEADLIKGHICTGLSSQIARIKQEEVQQKIQQQNVLMIASNKATQWVFMQEESVERMGREIRGKIYIEITSAAAVLAQEEKVGTED